MVCDYSKLSLAAIGQCSIYGMEGDYEMKTSYSSTNFAYTLYKKFKSVMFHPNQKHYYNDVIMSAMASQITSVMIFYSTVYSGLGQRNIKAPRLHGTLTIIYRTIHNFNSLRN